MPGRGRPPLHGGESCDVRLPGCGIDSRCCALSLRGVGGSGVCGDCDPARGPVVRCRLVWSFPSGLMGVGRGCVVVRLMRFLYGALAWCQEGSLLVF